MQHLPSLHDQFQVNLQAPVPHPLHRGVAEKEQHLSQLQVAPEGEATQDLLQGL